MKKSEPAILTAFDRHVAVVPYIEPPPVPRTRKEVVVAICQHIIDGDRVHLACSKEGITWPTLWLWKSEDGELYTLYARAREASGESWEDKSTKHTEEATTENVQLSRLREDNARWRAKMANPKQYGDKIDLTSAGARIGLEELVAGSMEKKPA